MFRYFLLVVCTSFSSLAAVGDPVLLTDPPSNFQLKAEVAAVLIFINDQVLLLQRLPTLHGTSLSKFQILHSFLYKTVISNSARKISLKLGTMSSFLFEG